MTRTIEVLGVKPRNQINLTQFKKPIEIMGVKEHVREPITVMGPKSIEILGKPDAISLKQVPFKLQPDIRMC
jgi:hypothetical protein